jgi:hypothetical protein
LSALDDGLRWPYSWLIKYASIIFRLVQSVDLSHTPEGTF